MNEPAGLPRGEGRPLGDPRIETGVECCEADKLNDGRPVKVTRLGWDGLRTDVLLSPVRMGRGTLSGLDMLSTGCKLGKVETLSRGADPLKPAKGAAKGCGAGD